MIVAQFNLSTLQARFLLTFRKWPDTRVHPDGASALDRNCPSHPSHAVGQGHYVPIVNKLIREGYILHHGGKPVEGTCPGYTITPKGEMILRIVEEELRRNLQFFDDALEVTAKPEPKKPMTPAKRRKA